MAGVIIKQSYITYPLSYGEAFLKNGQTEEAIKMYKRSIELNPKNENGKKVLEKIVK